jgi:starch synthase
MRILFATSELYPLIKTGGLADVSYSLPMALAALGHDIRIVLPFYRAIKNKLKPDACLFKGKVFGYEGLISLYSTSLSDIANGEAAGHNIEVFLVDAPDLFDRDGGPYADENNAAWGDSAYRFTIFSRVVAMLGNKQLGLNWQPELVHCNDWQTGLVPPLLQLEKNPPASLFTIHNLAYQGNFPKVDYDHLLLPADWWSIDGLEFYGECSFLKAGVMFADWVTTVSPTYAKEIQTPALGERFDGILRYRKDRFVGILNGADYGLWSPQNDIYIDTPYSADSIELKQCNKTALQEKLGLPIAEKIPMFGMICRMAYQKGVDLVLDAIPMLLKKKLQIVILGSGDIYYETAFKRLQQQFPGKLSVTIGYDEALSHQIEAGADFFLMPSRYEPCGLNQIYSLRYGTLPIVRNTGGLADTVIDVDEQTLAANTASGFVFEHASAVELADSVNRALRLYRNQKKLRQARLSAMSKNFSWEASSLEYDSLYRAAVQYANKKKP